jgi:hypothetical protein
MSEPGEAPDPIDKAYVEAEALLDDAAARAARRARVLAAVAVQGAPEASASVSRPSPWRRGGWLVAASVSGLALAVASQLYRSPPPPSKPADVRASPAPASPSQARLPAPQAEVPPPGKSPPSVPPRAVLVEPAAPPPAASAPVAPAPQAFPNAHLPPLPSPPPLPLAPPVPDVVPSEQAAPVNAPKSLAGGADTAESIGEVVVTGRKRSARSASAPSAFDAFAGPSRDAPDPAAQLRAAAAAGRTGEVRALLQAGASVDAADADGDTALMKAIQADQPGAAALLVRRGASLDLKNGAGESARDMARERGDADLDRALGVAP